MDAFRNRVELIVLNPATNIDTPFFREFLREHRIRKQECTVRMNENHYGNIFLGTIYLSEQISDDKEDIFTTE